MKSWALILCEGAHDQAALAGLVQVCAGWERVEKIPSSLPEAVAATYPQPRFTGLGGWIYEPPPDYLEKGGHFLVVRALRGVDTLLSEKATEFLSALRPQAVAVVVDADSAGVSSRLASFQTVYSQRYPHAQQVQPGKVVRGSPHLGLWIAPDNKSNGKMDEHLLKALSLARKPLAAVGKRFIRSLERVEPGAWSSHKNKAILGAASQTVLPGASLASALHKSRCWLSPNLDGLPQFKKLLAFIEALAVW